MSDISDLLVREIDLLLEFNAFLPSGYSFEFQPDGTVVQLSPTQHVLLSQSWNERGEPSPLPVPPSKESFKSSYRSSMNRSKQALDEMHLEIEDLSGSVRKLSSEPTFHGTFSQVYRGKCNSAQVCSMTLCSAWFLINITGRYKVSSCLARSITPYYAEGTLEAPKILPSLNVRRKSNGRRSSGGLSFIQISFLY